MTSIKDLLSTPADDVKAPPPMPEGTYRCQVVGQPEFGKSRQKQTPQVVFQYQVVEAMDDVEEELPDNWQEKKLRTTFYLTPDALFRLTDHMRNDLGLETKGKSVEQLLTEVGGCSVLCAVAKKATEGDDEGWYNEITKFAADA